MRIFFKRSIKNVSTLNNSGFTMLEMLYGFSIFLIIIAFLPLSFKLLFHHDLIEARTQNMEWHVFINQLKKELRLSEGISIENGKLILKRNGQDVLYEKYNKSIRRRVNYTGHEVVLQQVDIIRFDYLKDGVRITVTDIFSQNYSAIIYSFLELEGNDDTQ